MVTTFTDQSAKPGASQFITQEEESSGPVVVTHLVRTDANDTKSYAVVDWQIHVRTFADGNAVYAS
jgi:hypothetical protein